MVEWDLITFPIRRLEGVAGGNKKYVDINSNHIFKLKKLLYEQKLLERKIHSSSSVLVLGKFQYRRILLDTMEKMKRSSRSRLLPIVESGSGLSERQHG